MTANRKDATPTPAPAQRYKRSWKNLLLNKKYQLRFTLFMVGLSSALMIGLGFWVMQVANETTKVSAISVQGTPCPAIPEIEMPEALPAVPMKLPGDNDQVPAPTPPANPIPEDGEGGEGDERPRVTVQLDESSMEIVPPQPVVPPDLGAKIVAHWTCQLKHAGELDDLERGRMRILYVLVGVGLLLVLGLALYGIKMTHKVAGPLFKVGLYFNKMRQGRFDRVYNLRKGDQLVDFYEHFKHGHAGVVQMQKDDIARIKAVVEAAEQCGLGDHSVVIELRDMLARKEKSLE